MLRTFLPLEATGRVCVSLRAWHGGTPARLPLVPAFCCLRHAVSTHGPLRAEGCSSHGGGLLIPVPAVEGAVLQGAETLPRPWGPCLAVGGRDLKPSLLVNLGEAVMDDKLQGHRRPHTGGHDALGAASEWMCPS